MLLDALIGCTISFCFPIKHGCEAMWCALPNIDCYLCQWINSVLYKTKLRCHIGCTFTGALGYADDIILLASTEASRYSVLDTYLQMNTV